jgi:hypothetical protein
MIIQALILANERNNIHGKYLTNNGARIAMPTVEWKHPQYAFNKSRASDDSTKNHRPLV